VWARVNISLRVLIAILVPFVALGAVMGLLGGKNGLIVVGVMAFVSLPVAGIACLVTFVAAPAIARKPFVWAFAAVVVAWLAAVLVAHSGGGILSSFITLPAMGLFLWSFQKWPSPFAGTSPD
jgi:hypothetical protein